MKYRLLKVAAIQTILMAIYHFFIPGQFNWSAYMADFSPTINWSLLAINNYFSFNLLILGLTYYYSLKKYQDNQQLINLLSILVLSFWVFSTIYQLIEPMPLPKRLSWLSILLPSIAGFNSVVIILAYLCNRNFR